MLAVTRSKHVMFFVVFFTKLFFFLLSFYFLLLELILVYIGIGNSVIISGISAITITTLSFHGNDNRLAVVPNGIDCYKRQPLFTNIASEKAFQTTNSPLFLQRHESCPANEA